MKRDYHSPENHGKNEIVSLNEIERIISHHNPNPNYRDDKIALKLLAEALIAVKEGNFGISACLVMESDGDIVQIGRNRMFYPYFRSDLHAEMDVITQYENRVKYNDQLMYGLVLYTSLEPCPMCTGRIIMSGIEKVYYLASDPEGGMINSIDLFPNIFKELWQGKEYGPMDVSPELKILSENIFNYSRDILNKKVKD